MFEQVRSEASMTDLFIVILATPTAATSIAHEGEHEASSSTGEDEVVPGTIDFPTDPARKSGLNGGSYAFSGSSRCPNRRRREDGSRMSSIIPA